MPTKILNVIIIVSLIGIALISFKDSYSTSKAKQVENTKSQNKDLPKNNNALIQSDKSIEKLKPIECSKTFLSDLDFEKFTYDSTSKELLPSDLSSLEDKENKNENYKIELELVEQTDTSITLSTNTSEENDVSINIECEEDFIFANISGIRLALLPASSSVKAGASWESSLPFAGFKLKYEIQDVKEKTLYGKARDVATVIASLDGIGDSTIEYTLVSGIGIETLSANLNLLGVGGYNSDIKLTKAELLSN